MKALDVSAAFDGGLDDLERLHAWLDTLAGEAAGLNERTLSRIRLALAEGFTNAVLHAHGGAAGRSVGVRISREPGPGAPTRLDVKDSGPGFVLPPPAPPAEHAECGRGLLILRALADRVEYRDNTLSLWLRSD
jgi:anti-sigma regulatory factor (Ser/Thr protein kinase)